MNIAKLRGLQKILDNRIIKQHGLEGQNLVSNLILALQVEIAELANETGCFKHWSNKGPSERETILTEFVDGLRFILSISNQLDVKIEFRCEDETEKTIVGTFNKLFYYVGEMWDTAHNYPDSKLQLADDVETIFNLFMELGTKHLGFTHEDIEQAYLEKNKVNHQRQDDGY
ncbi:dUTPase [Bacillus cereus]|uniref:dUTP diphosphatase n=1 Tax=Bacillus cereus TaxID=1396 RepID=UPI000BF49A08|nr:dUTP diphosphatase [Bacillus cereus]PFC44724.1 dUTPase [Bacillus cereus]PFJ84843.1 dUTPase [Bacillus cereus]PGO72103.1 dUTPase [Bacillus cereus]